MVHTTHAIYKTVPGSGEIGAEATVSAAVATHTAVPTGDQQRRSTGTQLGQLRVDALGICEHSNTNVSVEEGHATQHTTSRAQGQRTCVRNSVLVVTIGEAEDVGQALGAARQTNKETSA